MRITHDHDAVFTTDGFTVDMFGGRNAGFSTNCSLDLTPREQLGERLTRQPMPSI